VCVADLQLPLELYSWRLYNIDVVWYATEVELMECKCKPDECKRMLSDGSFVPPPGWAYMPDLQAEVSKYRLDALRYRFIRQSEEDISTQLEEILARAWEKVSKKGCWLGKMDAVIDEAIRLTSDLEDGS
jgi:hypothetical protein